MCGSEGVPRLIYIIESISNRFLIIIKRRWPFQWDGDQYRYAQKL